MDKIDKLVEQFVKPTRCNYMNILYEEHEVLPHFERINFKLNTSDKKQLSCIYFRLLMGTDKPVKTVIYNHSHGSCKFEGVNLLGHCQAFGYNLLVYDSRACGESSGDTIFFGSKEKVDLLFIMLYLSMAHKVENFILWGRSIGCNAVLQFYQSLISSDGDFMNRVIKIQANKPNIKHEKDSKVVYSVSRINPELYPPMFNKFIHRHFEEFFIQNSGYVESLKEINISIDGMVLDSPYESFTSFIEDNMKKVVNFMPGMVSSIANMYLKGWMNSKLNVNIEEDQNIDLITKINLNSVFIISDKDEIVTFDRYKNIIQSYAKKFPHKNKCEVINTGKSHGSRRAKEINDKAFLVITQNKSSANTYSFKYKHQNQNHSNSSFNRPKTPKGGLLTSLNAKSNFISNVNGQNNSSFQSTEQKGISLYSHSPTRKVMPQHRSQEEVDRNSRTHSQATNQTFNNLNDADFKGGSFKIAHTSFAPQNSNLNKSKDQSGISMFKDEEKLEHSQKDQARPETHHSLNRSIVGNPDIGDLTNMTGIQEAHNESEDESFATRVAESLVHQMHEEAFDGLEEADPREVDLTSTEILKGLKKASNENLEFEHIE
jgi:hypothetical protein